MSLESSINTVANIAERLLRTYDLYEETLNQLDIAVEKGNVGLEKELRESVKALLKSQETDRRLIGKIADAATRKKS